MKKTKHLYWIIPVFIVVIGFVLFFSLQKKGPGQYDSFAQCLTMNGATMYGTEWCPHCQAQKKLFGSSFEYVHYVDCDKNMNTCVAAGVEGYPTWVVGNESKAGTQSMYTLSQLTGCDLVALTTK